MEEIVKLINNNAWAYRERPDHSKWREQRVETLETLKDLKTKLDNVCLGVNYAKGVGSGAQVVGAVTSIIGQIMAIEESPSAVTVMNVGRMINESGDLVKEISKIVERHLSAEFLQKVKTTLDKDKELSEPLQDWLGFSRNLDANVKTVFGSNLISVIQNNTVNVFSEFATLYNPTKEFVTTLNNMKRGKFEMLISRDIEDKLLKFSKELEAFPDLRNFTTELNNWLQFLPAVKDGFKAFKNIKYERASTIESLPKNQMPIVSTDSDGMNAIKNVGTVEMAFNNTAPMKEKCPSPAAASAYCGLQAIDIATGVISLISAVKVIIDGKSKFSDAIKQISDLLEAELRTMEKLYGM